MKSLEIEGYTIYHDFPILASSSSDSLFLSNNSKEVSFSDIRPENYCVCYVDIINSTTTTSKLSSHTEVAKYYTIFLNSMAIIIRNFAGKIIKNAGDCLISYFPKTSDSNNRLAFKDVIECAITMVSAHHVINARLYENKLPSLDLRISADYGSLSIAKIASSASNDLFGSSMNICSKINSKAATNGIVIGQELYRYLSQEDYIMKEVGSYGQYSIYSVTSRHERRILNPFKRISDQRVQFSRLSTPDTKLSDNRQHNRAASIILIDDEPDTLFTFKSFLAKEGYNVEEFMDSKQALQYIEKMNLSYYDLVITDIKMPTFNGLELYQRIRAINTKIKVLFVSALDAADMLVSVLPGVQPNDIIRKPVDEERFMERVKSTLVRK